MSDVPVVCYFGVDPGCGIDVGPLPPVPPPPPPTLADITRFSPSLFFLPPAVVAAPAATATPPARAIPRPAAPMRPSYPTLQPVKPPPGGIITQTPPPLTQTPPPLTETPYPLPESAPVADLQVAPFSLEDPAAASLAKQAAWQEIAALAGKIVAGVFDFVTLAAYSAALGPSAQEEAAIVQQTISSSEPNPYYNPDYQPDPYAEPTPAIGPLAAPDTTGLPEPGVEPAMQPLTVTATRLGPAYAPFGLPGLDPLSAIFQQPGIFLAPSVSAPTRTATRVGSQPVTTGFGRAISPNQVPGLETSPLLGPIVAPIVGIAPSPPYQPPEIPQGGQPASAADCAPPQSGKKQKKKKAKRTICHKGTYYERANGLLKFKQEQIPCR